MKSLVAGMLMLLAYVATQTYSEFSISQTLVTPAMAATTIEKPTPTPTAPAIKTTPTTKTVSQPAPVPNSTILDVPFYSQFTDITSPQWQKVGCGVASLAMIVDYYTHAVPVNTLLKQGIASGAYLKNVGWTYKGLIQLSTKYGLDGESYDLAKLSTKNAFAQFKERLKDGPVIASVHYKFDPKSTIPHLVVIDSIDGDMLYYNDPAAKTGNKQISTADFLKAWKKRFIVIRPAKDNLSFAGPVSTLFLPL